MGATLLGIGAFRTTLAAWAAERWLAGAGVEVAGLKVEEIGWRRARLAGLSAGRDGELSLNKAVIDYRIRDLLAGRIETIQIEGLMLSLDLTGTGPPLGSLQAPLQAVMDRARPADGPGAGPPRLALEGGRIEARTPYGPATLDFEGVLEPGGQGAARASGTLALSASSGRVLGRLQGEVMADGRITGGLRIDQGTIALGGNRLAADVLGGGLEFDWYGELRHLEGQLSLEAIRLARTEVGAADLQFDITGTDFSAKGNLAARDKAAALEFTARVADYLVEPQVDAELEVTADATAPIWEIAGLLRPRAGHGRLVATVRGRVPAVPAFDTGVDGIWSWLSSGDLTADLLLELDGVTLPGRVESLKARLPIEAKLAVGSAVLLLRLNAKLATPGPVRDWLAAKGLGADWLGPRVAATLTGRGMDRARVRIVPDHTGLEILFDGDAVIETSNGADLSAAGSLSLGLTADYKPARLRLEALRIAARSRAISGTPLTALAVSGQLSGVAAQQAIGPADRHAFTHDLVLAAAALDLEVALEGKPPVAVRAKVGRIQATGEQTPERAYRGNTVLSDARIDVPQLFLAVEGLSGQVSLGTAPDVPLVRFAAKALRDLHIPAYINPLGVTGRILEKGETLALQADVSGPAAPGLGNIRGTFSPDRKSGEVNAVLSPLVFEPGGMQPAELSPWLKDLREVAGAIEATAQIGWDPKGFHSEAAIGVRDMAFRTDSFAVAGLRLGLNLDNLMPPSSPSSQNLVAARVDVGVPLRDVTARFQILPGNTPRIGVEQAEFSLAGGRYHLDETLVDFARPDHALDLKVIDLDLGALFEAIQIEGLTGTGRLSGTLPLRIDKGAFTVSDARLEARVPGVLRYRSPAAASALKSGGQSVKLLLEALHDFHYDALAVTGVKDKAGETRLRIEMRGKNPTVLEGHPFKFNITLSGNLTPILNALGEGHELSSELIRRTWKLQQ
ncbi:MAG: YdbH domain-containing protein [Rhodospirillales bacterium]|nr:YdbH domain-containing protein [Rhodospirillales bacterium]